MTYDYCEKVSMSDIREKIPDLVVMEKWAPHVREVNVLGSHDYLLFDGNEIVVEGKKYRLKGYENRLGAVDVLKGWGRPRHIGSAQMPCLYYVCDAKGVVCCVHDWMSDEEVKGMIKDGVSGREEIPPYERRMEGRE